MCGAQRQAAVSIPRGQGERPDPPRDPEKSWRWRSPPPRWAIDVFFNEMKQQLRLDQCKSRDLDAQTAHVTTCCILCIFLAYFRRVHAYAPLGALFEGMAVELGRKISRNGCDPCFRNSWRLSAAPSPIPARSTSSNSNGSPEMLPCPEESFFGQHKPSTSPLNPPKWTRASMGALGEHLAASSPVKKPCVSGVRNSS